MRFEPQKQASAADRDSGLKHRRPGEGENGST